MTARGIRPLDVLADTVEGYRRQLPRHVRLSRLRIDPAFFDAVRDDFFARWQAMARVPAEYAQPVEYFLIGGVRIEKPRR